MERTTNELIKRLEEYIPDPETIYGILVYAETKEERQAIIDFIDKGDDVDCETIVCLSLELDLNRNK